MTSDETPLRVLVIVEDDPDAQLLVEAIFSLDSRFNLSGVAVSAETALDGLQSSEPGVIVLDHGLAGAMTGLEAAPLLKAKAPQAKIILFTAHAELRIPAASEPAIDAFLLKTDATQLLPLAQRLAGLGARPS